jgi:hypothetical protein
VFFAIRLLLSEADDIMFHIDFVLHPFDFSDMEIKTPFFGKYGGLRRDAQRASPECCATKKRAINFRRFSRAAETHAVRLYIFAHVPPSDNLVFHTDGNEVIFIKLPVRIAI